MKINKDITKRYFTVLLSLIERDLNYSSFEKSVSDFDIDFVSYLTERSVDISHTDRLVH